MKRGTRIVNLIIIIFVVLSYFFSIAYKYHNEHHNCTGEDCPICLVLDSCEKTIEEFKFIPGGLEKAILVIAVFVFAIIVYKVVKLLVKQDTLVSNHIKMLN